MSRFQVEAVDSELPPATALSDKTWGDWSYLVMFLASNWHKSANSSANQPISQPKSNCTIFTICKGSNTQNQPGLETGTHPSPSCIPSCIAMWPTRTPNSALMDSEDEKAAQRAAGAIFEPGDSLYREPGSEGKCSRETSEMSAAWSKSRFGSFSPCQCKQGYNYSSLSHVVSPKIGISRAIFSP